jgi:DNA replication regulator SLD3
VLIASLDLETSLYAIERVKPRIYALCRLRNWVKIGYLEDESAVAHTPIARQLQAHISSDTTQWWKKAVVSEHDGLERPMKRPRLSMAPPITPEKQVEISPTQPTLIQPIFEEIDTLPDFTPSQPDQPVSSQERLDTFVRQYLDALYKSRTSLAFFAKGPLSRARNAFMLSVKDGLSVSDLATFLRSMVLPLNTMDKKYREKIPTLIRAMPLGMLSDSEQEGLVSTKKRKSKKLPKLSKDGFYAFEDDPCKRWWLMNGSDSKPHQNETVDQLLRRRIGHLRVRETLAQIILVLEIMALEASSAFKAINSDPPANGEDESQAGAESQTTKKKRKPKKALDLDVQLDLLLDKLTIWQSIEQDESSNAEASKEHDPSSRDNADKLEDRDILASFCVEVIIPFFKSKVPEKAAMVNKKFGGPGAVSPEKLKKPKAPQIVEKKPRRPLQKTPSDSNMNLKAHPPTLTRSATDSMMPRLKRETSDISLLEIPQARPVKRDSSVQLKHLRQRQIDMFAISAATDAKLKQKAKIAEDLKDAISTLKKPNRGQAVKDYVDASEQRSLGSASMRKKTAGTNRKIFQNVQVSATPRTARKRDALRPAVPSYSQGTHALDFDIPPFPSSDFMIPSSAIRPLQLTESGKTPSSNHLQPHGVTETPSRGKSKMVSFDSSPPSMPQEEAHHNFIGSAAAANPTSVTSFTDFLKQEIAQDGTTQNPSREKQTEKRTRPAFTTPQKPKAIFATPTKPAPVFATPQKRIERPITVAQTPETRREEAGDAVGGQSIYDALGWNDDYDELV